jgi:threonine/homoserine/homoserine lactone efflux protein
MPVLIDFILKAISIGFSAGVTPGPLQAVFLSLAMKGGWKKALPAAFAPIVSDGPVMLLVLLVLNNLPDQFLVTLQIAGAIFLLYLAWDAFKAFRNYQAIEEIQTISGWGTLLKATLMNILGPGPWLFWSLINGPNLLQAWEIAPWWGILYISSFYGVFILTNIALIVLFSSMRKMGEKVRRALLLLSAILLVGFAVYSFLQGIQLI